MPATARSPARQRGIRGRDGHDKDYGRFLVASGPYMFKGSEALDFSVPAKEQEPVAGYVPGRSIELVRNPSWSADTDELRLAYPDEIVTEIGGDNDDLQQGRAGRDRPRRRRRGPAGEAQGLPDRPRTCRTG